MTQQQKTDIRQFALQSSIEVFKQPQFSLQVNSTNIIGLAEQFSNFIENGIPAPIPSETEQTNLDV